MINDAELVLSKEQAVTTAAASTNVIDMGPKGVGDPEGLKAHICVDTGVTSADSAGTATVTFKVQASNAEDFGTSGTTVDLASASVLNTALTQGKEVVLDFGEVKDRYLRIYYNPSTTLTAGKFSARLVYPGTQTNRGA